MFSKETEYALRGLIYIQLQNLKGRRPGMVEIAKEIEAPTYYTGKILQRLVKQGFIESQKGKGGGFYFDSNKPELALKNVIVATESDKIFTGCGLGLRNCNDDNPCPLHPQYQSVRDSINQLMTEETIQSVANKIKQSKNDSVMRLKN